MVELAREVRRRHFGLWLIGGLNLCLALVFLALMPLDPRTVTGLDAWVKPFKFAASVGIYLWTVAWLLPHLRIPAWLRSTLGWAVALTLLIENSLLMSQAARGVPSHFNFATGYDAAVFAAMGVLIGVNSVLVVLLLALFVLRPAPLPPAYLWGIRLGLLLLILGSAHGGLMIAHGGHTVGAADGGPGLPLVGWSTTAGDHRPAHLIALHGLQFLPLAGWWLSRRRRWSDGRQVAALVAVAAAYLALGLALFGQAMAGRPLLPL